MSNAEPTNCMNSEDARTAAIGMTGFKRSARSSEPTRNASPKQGQRRLPNADDVRNVKLNTPDAQSELDRHAYT